MTTLKIGTAITVLLLTCSTQVHAKRHHYAPQQLQYTCDNNARCFGQMPVQVTRVAKSERRVGKKRYAKRTKSKRIVDANGNRAKGKSPPWNMVQVKTVQGIYITVHPAYAHKFLKFFEILEREHVKIPKGLVGCYARGHHVSGSNHYIGAACDIQTGWNRTIPALYHAGKWIKEAGLYDGCSFGDCGHIEAIRGTHNKPPPLIAALEKFKREQATANYQP